MAWVATTCIRDGWRPVPAASEPAFWWQGHAEIEAVTRLTMTGAGNMYRHLPPHTRFLQAQIEQEGEVLAAVIVCCVA